MPFAEPETALPATINPETNPEIHAEKIAPLQPSSAVLRIINHLHEDSIT
jgi:hypothetical protein